MPLWPAALLAAEAHLDKVALTREIANVEEAHSCEAGALVDSYGAAIEGEHEEAKGGGAESLAGVFQPSVDEGESDAATLASQVGAQTKANREDARAGEQRRLNRHGANLSGGAKREETGQITMLVSDGNVRAAWVEQLRTRGIFVAFHVVDRVGTVVAPGKYRLGIGFAHWAEGKAHRRYPLEADGSRSVTHLPADATGGEFVGDGS